jgi:hypothetical protein
MQGCIIREQIGSTSERILRQNNEALKNDFVNLFSMTHQKFCVNVLIYPIINNQQQKQQHQQHHLPRVKKEPLHSTHIL